MFVSVLYLGVCYFIICCNISIGFCLSSHSSDALGIPMEIRRDNQPLYISENEVKKLLSWPSVYEACEEALRSVSGNGTSDNQSSAIQPARQRILMNNDTGMDHS